MNLVYGGYLYLCSRHYLKSNFFLIMKMNYPLPDNELDRVIRLSDFDLDYSHLQNSLQDLTKLTAKVAGTSISLVNLIDSFTQWTVSNFGLAVEQMPREESVCQYTIVVKDNFEVKNLKADDRFKERDYVAGPLNLSYYFGVPLQTADGYNLGALCVMDQVGKEISPEKVELLKIIANEIVNRLTAIEVIRKLKESVKQAKETQRKVAHDIRGPLGGIISLAQIVSSQGDANKMDQVLDFMNLIHKSGTSLLDLANEILANEKKPAVIPGDSNTDVFNLMVLKDKLDKLFTPQAIPKNITFTVTIKTDFNVEVPFSKNKVLQIAGNLISNAIKFTGENGFVNVDLSLITDHPKKLMISVSDTGIGMDAKTIERIYQGKSATTDGTDGEQGYGFGLPLVKHLIGNLGGSLRIESRPGEGTVFHIEIPQG